ncbi:MAG: AAA family ATPase [Cyanobacteria bacterium J06600_6]
MNHNFENQEMHYIQGSSAFDNAEGGLKLGDMKSTVMRKLPLVVAITLGMTSLAFFKTMLIPPVYVASVELLPESLNVETKVTADGDSGEVREDITAVKLDDIQLKKLKSPATISRAIETLAGQYPELDYETLTDDLEVRFIRDSQNKKNVLSVSYEHADKKQVADVMEVLTQTFLDYSADQRTEGIERGIKVLEAQIPKVSVQVRRLEGQMDSLRDRYGFIEPEISLDPITSRKSIMAQEEDNVASELQQMRSKLRNLDRELSFQPTTSPTAIELATPRYQGLLNQLREIDIEIGRKSAIFSSRAIEMQVLQEERQRIIGLTKQATQAIRQRLVNDIRTLENRQRVAQRESAKLRSELKNWSNVANDYSKLEQELVSAREELSGYTQKRDALLIDAARQGTPWELLAPAGEPLNTDLSTSNRLFLGSSLGLLLGMGMALMLDKSQKIIYTSAKAEEITNLPVLGSIPHTPQNKKLALLGQAKNANAKQLPPSQTSQGLDLYRDPDASDNLAFPNMFPSSIEAFRSFAANLGLLNFSTDSEFLKFDTNLRSIAITSAISGEGKSTVALNLARASASMGRKVLIVDADVRSKVCLTESLGLESEVGLKNLLNQPNSSLALEHVRKSPLDDNLYILSSGFSELMSQESSRLLASGEMFLLMEELKENFDLVIYDMCAVVGYADVNLLAGKTDGVILVTGLGKIDQTLLTRAVEQLKMASVPVLGIAANNVTKV